MDSIQILMESTECSLNEAQELINEAKIQTSQAFEDNDYKKVFAILEHFKGQEEVFLDEVIQDEI